MRKTWDPEEQEDNLSYRPQAASNRPSRIETVPLPILRQGIHEIMAIELAHKERAHESDNVCQNDMLSVWYYIYSTERSQGSFCESA